MEILISLLSGAVGGNIGGAALKKYSMGTIGNSIAGLVGGGLGGQLLGSSVGEGAISQIASGAGGGVLVMVIAGIAKSMFAK